MIQPPANNSELLSIAIKSLDDLLTARNVPPEPLDSLASVEGFANLYKTLVEVRNAIMAITTGDQPFQGSTYYFFLLASILAVET